MAPRPGDKTKLPEKDMSSSKDAIRGSLVVLEAVDAARDTRAFLLFLGSAVAALVAAGIFLAIASVAAANGVYVLAGLFTFIGWFVGMLIAATGVSATGKTLMDRIQRRPVLSVRDVLIFGLMTLPKLAAIFLIEIAIFVCFLVILAIVLFICKIPVVGALLYTVVYPIASVAGGILWFSFGFVVNPLAAPAFWEGYTVRQTLAVLGVSRKAFNIGRLLPPVVQLLVLLFIAGIVAFITSAIVFSGSAFVATMGSAMIGFGRNFFAMGSSFGLGAMSMGGLGGMSDGLGGYVLATIVGASILGAIAATFPLLVYLAGTCSIFLNLAGANDEVSSPALPPAAPQNVPFRPSSKPAAPAVIAAAPTSATNAQNHCAKCGARAEPHDVFCGECGADLPRAE